MARLEELERKFEENPRRYFAPLANEYRKAGEAQRAADLCRSQLPAVPGHISGHIVLGQALYDARDFDGSRAALEAALALDPENIVALRYLGDIARDSGDAAEAERWYSRTLEADPYNEAATTALEALRAAPAPAGGSSPSETQQTAEPEPPTPVETSPVTEVAPPVGVADAGQIEAAQDLQPAYQAELSGTELPGQLESSVEATGAEPEVAAEAMQPADQLATETPEAVAPPPQAAPELESSPSGVLKVTGEFAGDLSVSIAPETTDPAPDESALDEPAADEPAAAEPAAAEPAAAEPAEERFDVAAHAPSEPETLEEAIQAEERVLESAAPFVTETMADLYLEQGYPHEALELLLQLSEQRPQDEQLRAKVEHIESVIVARRDAAVAAARAERAETAETAEAAEAAEGMEAPEAAVEAVEPTEPPDAPISVRELFARMDRARPRAASSVTPRPISRRRSDFVPMPEGEAATSEASDDPFAFPNPAAPEPVPRTSGPQQTFNPSTADNDDFDAWLRGLRGP